VNRAVTSFEKFVVKSPPVTRWESLSFTSTLYLRPILDALLEPTPDPLHDELRLGLQEALVNAAKHGNGLDPQKVVSVRYAEANGCFWWIVTDQGEGFMQSANCVCPSPDVAALDMAAVSECGRGLFILHQVFDQVVWSKNGKEVHLAKQVRPASLVGLISPGYCLRALESWWRKWSPTSAQGT
jgi:anti-sigma regulatory factor (Ser/Thr protein kinase)